MSERASAARQPAINFRKITYGQSNAYLRLHESYPLPSMAQPLLRPDGEAGSADLTF
jgi:hypothetical protein